MILWLAAAVAAAAVLLSLPRQASSRLTAFRDPDSRPSAAVPPRLSRTTVLAGVVLASGLAVAGAPIGLALGVGVVPSGLQWLRSKRVAAKQRTDRESAVVEVTFALAAELRAGRTTQEALASAAESAGPLRHVLAAAAASVAVGGSAATELEAGADLPGAERLRAVAATWRVTESAGGRVALVLERLGEAMDHDLALRGELQAAVAAPQATMKLLAGLPLVGIGIGQAVGADPLHILFYEPLGWALLAGAGLFDTAGILISRRITRRAMR